MSMSKIQQKKQHNSKFRFKQFELSHNQSSMKIGTDALLLGAWVDTLKAKNILDVGTGCGVIAIMMAQRNPNAHVSGIDIDEPSIQEATKNATDSPWSSRITMYVSSLQAFTSKKPLDLIVSNPPFFENGTLPPYNTRKRARHNQTLQSQEVIDHSARLLAQRGKLAIILPVDEANQFISKADSSGFHLVRQMIFRPKTYTKPERFLMEFCRNKSDLKIEELTHYNEFGSWTKSYQNLTSKFHLRAKK